MASYQNNQELENDKLKCFFQYLLNEDAYSHDTQKKSLCSSSR